MSDDEESDSFLPSLTEPNIQLGLFVATLVIGAPLFWLFTEEIVYGFTTRIELLGIYVSAVLTLALITVYAEIAKRERIQSREAERQADLQEKQTQFHGTQIELQKEITELQDAQQEYIEANHEPVVQIIDWTARYTSDGRDFLELELENKGNGLAQNIHVKPRLGIYGDTPAGEIYIDVKEYLSGGPSPEGIHSFASPVVESTVNLVGQSGSVLQANESSDFHADIQFFRNKFDRQKEDFVIADRMAFSDILKQVNKVESLSVTIELQYENILGEPKSKDIFSDTVEPDGAKSLVDLIQDHHSVASDSY